MILHKRLFYYLSPPYAGFTVYTKIFDESLGRLKMELISLF